MEFHFEKPDLLKEHLSKTLPHAKEISRVLLDRPEDVDAAVLALFALNHSHEPWVLMTRRTETVEKHKGQMAFPGGHCDPEDFNDRGHTTTALRETFEEVGIEPRHITIAHQIKPFSTPTGFRLHPLVGALNIYLEEAPLEIDPHETAEAFWIPVRVLVDPTTYKLEDVEYQGKKVPIHAYYFNGHRIWGATAAILHHVLRAAFGSNTSRV